MTATQGVTVEYPAEWHAARAPEHAAARAWLDEEVGHLEYLNDAWTFAMAREEPWGGALGDLEVVVTWHLTSIHDDAKDIRFRQWVDLSRPARRRDLDGVHRAIFHTIGLMETHERLEGLRSRGRPCFDPHPDGPNIPRVRL